MTSKRSLRPEVLRIVGRIVEELGNTECFGDVGDGSLADMKRAESIALEIADRLHIRADRIEDRKGGQ